MPQAPDRSDPRVLLGVLWRWKLLVLALLVLVPAIAYYVESRKQKEYQSSALVAISDATVGTSGVPGGGGGSFTTTNINAVARLVTTAQVASTAAQLLHQPAIAGSILGRTSASGDTNTGFLTITTQDSNPRRAAAIANAFAAALNTNRQTAAIAQIDHQIGVLQNQLAQVPPGLTGQASRQQLQGQLTQLRAQRAGQGGNAQLIQPATASSTPVSPHPKRAVELGLVIGLLLGLGAAALAENSDRRFRDATDVEEFTKLPLLSAVSARAFAAPVDSLGQSEEAFQMLRASLTYFNIDRRLTTLVIASPGEKEGKTLVAIRLAIAAARAGSNVILVDADLRRSGVTQRLGMTVPSGLGSVLVGERPLSDVLVDYRIEAVRAGGKLNVLPAGPPPPNPSELLSSREMQRLLGQLETQADLVVIDTPAALAVSDSLPLLPEASGVVLVARVGRTRREAVRRLQRMVTATRGTLLGVVATGTGAGPGYDHYAYGYEPSPNGRTHRGGLTARLRLRRKRASKIHSDFIAGPQKPDES